MVKQNKIVVYGLPCTGKSFSIATLFKLRNIRPKLRVIFLMTERNSMSGLERGLKHYDIKLEPNQLIYSVVKPKKAKTFGVDKNALKKYVMQNASQEQQADQTNMNKDKYSFFLDVIDGLEAFTGIDYVTGEEVKIGDVGQLDEEDILVIDGLSPITHAIWEITKGDRVGSHQGDYGRVQYWVKRFTQNLINIDASVILLAHADRVQDDIEKIEKMRISLDAGVALSGKYAGMWGNVIYAYVTAAGQRVWSGKKAGVEVAARDFPEKDGLLPDFSLYNLFRDDGQV